jgi:hypothetical protein
VSRLEAVLARLAADLRTLEQPFALVGGLAVSARSEPRFTRDIDVAVAVPDDRAAERLIHALGARGYAAIASLEQEAVGRLATVRLAAPAAARDDDGIVVDLLFASSGIEPEIVEAAEDLEVLPGVAVPVARTGHLVAQKVLAESPRRPQDRADLVALLREAGPEERARAQAAVELVMQRGFGRGRDLEARLRDWLREAG